LLKGAII